jgi:hypothetical protein
VATVHLPNPRGTYQRQPLAVMEPERHVCKSGAALVIAEEDAIEGNLSVEPGDEHITRRILNVRLNVQDIGDTLHADGRIGQLGGQPGHLASWLENILDVR